MAENTQVDVKKLSFERAIEELESIVKRLEEGKVPLEESVTIYERGEALQYVRSVLRHFYSLSANITEITPRETTKSMA